MKVRDVPMPVISYRGTRNRCEIAGLEPNRLYHFKLRYCGARANSFLSAPFVIMTAPLKPSPPILIEITSNIARIKWYPPKYGAYKFIVQLLTLGKRQSGYVRKSATGGSQIVSAAAAAQSSGVGGDGNGDLWIPVFNGSETVWMSTTLSPETEYVVRVLCVNYQGAVSEPSKEVAFATNKYAPSSSGNAPRRGESAFNIECTGDICVGDTIIITERLFTSGTSTGTWDDDNQSVKSMSSRNKTTNNQVPTTKKSNDKKSVVRLDMSTASMHSNDGTNRARKVVAGTGVGAGGREYIGERTIAAYVIKDNYKLCRDELAARKVAPKESKKFGQYRRLWLEVVWQRSSWERAADISGALKEYELTSGTVIERQQSVLEQFEVFRSPWEMETNRKALGEEWESLRECFIAADC